MSIFADILLPSILLLVVLGSQLAAILYPHYALETAEGFATLYRHTQDPKLQAIADYWASKLCPPDTGGAQGTSQRLAAEILWTLARHRFLTGDEPRRLRCRTKLSGILSQSQRQAGLEQSRLDMFICPLAVTTADGLIIWQKPAD